MFALAESAASAAGAQTCAELYARQPLWQAHQAFLAMISKDVPLSLSQRATLFKMRKEGLFSGPDFDSARAARAVTLAVRLKTDFGFRYFMLTGARPELFRKYSPKSIRRGLYLVEEAQSPYSTGYDLVQKAGTEPFRAMREILDFVHLTQKPGTLSERARAASDWVKSPNHALYLYRNLDDFEESASAVLAYLIQKNEYFKNVGRVRGPPDTLVTFSYEKETRKPVISEFYRNAKVPEDEWFKRSAAKREEELREIAAEYSGEVIPEKVVVPTALKPRSAGGLRNDAGFSDSAYSDGFIFEFTHKNFEIDEDRLLSQMREVQSSMKENDFHVHLVFDLPRKYEQMPEFSRWLKQANDYLYLKGMEEHGLHGNHLTKVAPEPFGEEKIKSIREAVAHGQPRELDPFWPLNPVDVETKGPSKSQLKYRTVGLRGGLYGDSADRANYVKIGLEFRDATRDVNTWSKIIKGFKKSVTDHIWEKPISPAPAGKAEVRLTQTALPEELDDLERHGLSKQFARTLSTVDPTFTLPLKDYAGGVVRDFHTGTFRQADPKLAKRATEAKAEYLEELRKLEKNWNDLRDRGEWVRDEDLKMAVQWTMSDWAKKARVSELFNSL